MQKPRSKAKEKGCGKGFATLKVKNPELHHELSVKGGKSRAEARWGTPFKKDKKDA